MTTATPSLARLAVGLSARAAIATGIYVAAAIVVLTTVILLRGLVRPDVLHGLLAFIFVATFTSGLEPGTVKAAALGPAGVDGPAAPAYLAVSFVKGVLAAPIIGLVWRFADPAVNLTNLVWLPLITVAGFGATDLRVLLDLRGHHGLAIALKQGSLAGGVALTGVALALGAPLFWAIGVSSLARTALLAGLPRLLGNGRGLTWSEMRDLLGDRRWVELAAVSVIAAASGSVDRVVGLRLLRPADYSAYYLLYELFTKFWLVSYLLGPILFARQASGGDSRAFIRGARAIAAAAGAAFLVGVAGALWLAPEILERVIGAEFGLATFGFAVAVVVGSFVQLRVAQLQGAGRARQAARALGLGAIVSIPVFFVAASLFGVRGLLLGFLAKTCVELMLITWGGRLWSYRANER